ncbi:hypothetical protein [Paenibacillus xylanexedens]|uniref:hypothetical protein n=1 Tax=Paenibacillus xylanexedens TaxID=528191 RepID=UPI0011AA7A9D|nr:hypothetical protein [Paenibacillus xylanexedens]
MDDLKVKAYKSILFQALLDIRQLSGAIVWDKQPQPEEGVQQLLTENVVQHAQEIFHISNAYHNLADALIGDLAHFNEENFWNQIDHLSNTFASFKHYKLLYEQFDEAKMIV